MTTCNVSAAAAKGDIGAAIAADAVADDAAGPSRSAGTSGPLIAKQPSSHGQSGRLRNPSVVKALPSRGRMPSVALPAAPAYDAGENTRVSLVAAVGADMDAILNSAAFEAAGAHCGSRPAEPAAVTASSQHAGAVEAITQSSMQRRHRKNCEVFAWYQIAKALLGTKLFVIVQDSCTFQSNDELCKPAVHKLH